VSLDRLLTKTSYTSGEVARVLGIAPRTARRYIATGQLHAEQHPMTRRWTVSDEALREFMQRYNLAPPPVSLPPR